VNVPAAFARYRDALEAEMRAVVGDDPALLYRIVRYHLGWETADGRPGSGGGGKALRPVLCLLACEGTAPDARGGGWPAQRALAAAAAIELIHNFSLIHDDIQDQDRERHHRPTAWTLWGVPQAINAGDGLWALATRAFLRTAARGVPLPVVVRAHAMLNDACLTMIEGQSLDISFEERRDVDVPRYLDMIGRKTGALIATALAIGALIGSGDEGVAAAYYRFGEHLGRVFQIRDDMLGVWGQEQRTGKSASSDLRRRKQTYPVVYTLSHGPPAARAALEEVYALPEIDAAAVARAVAALEEAGARDQAGALAAAAHAHALAALDLLPATPAVRADLREIAAFLLYRDF
jgi:geranylgeranyl diphosphate synthase type I